MMARKHVDFECTTNRRNLHVNCVLSTGMCSNDGIYEYERDVGYVEKLFCMKLRLSGDNQGFQGGGCHFANSTYKV